MSLTLRDAQHLCWKTFRKVSSTAKIDIATELVQEAKEVASRTKDFGKDTEFNEDPHLALAPRLSRLLFSIFVLAERSGIELEEAFLQETNDYIMSHLG